MLDKLFIKAQLLKKVKENIKNITNNYLSKNVNVPSEIVEELKEDFIILYTYKIPKADLFAEANDLISKHEYEEAIKSLLICKVYLTKYIKDIIYEMEKIIAEVREDVLL